MLYRCAALNAQRDQYKKNYLKLNDPADPNGEMEGLMFQTCQIWAA